MSFNGIAANRPTPVFSAPFFTTKDGELWVKNDGLTHPAYGGNKARKLEPILDAALRKRAKRIVTIGAAGSHHALATAVFARARGLRAAAVLCPQPDSEHARRTLADGLELGLEVHPVSNVRAIPFGVLRVLRAGDYFVPAGGSNVLGTRAYASALSELGEQIAGGLLPEPDRIVVALGSGGTAAGLLAGIARLRLHSTIVAVRVGGYAPLARPLVLGLASAALGPRVAPSRVRALSSQLVIEHGYQGSGYGVATPEALEASRAGKDIGLTLDLTYTAKTFAKALALLDFPGFGGHGPSPSSRSRTGRGRERPLRVLYWHTLAAARPAGLSSRGPAELPQRLSELFVRREV